MMTLLFLPTNLQKKKPLKMNIFIFLLHFMTLGAGALALCSVHLVNKIHLT